VNPILLDTNAYVAFMRGQSKAVAVLQHAPMIAVSPVILGELLCGFAAGQREQANREQLAAFLASPRVTLLPVDQLTAERYATVYLALRQAGTPIPTNDMWIAATAMQHGLSLFSYDGHFRAVDGIRLVASVEELEG